MIIAKFEPETEFATPERCHIVEMCNLPDAPTCSIALARVEPGVTTQLHSPHGVSERYVVLQGEGRVEVRGQSAGVVAPLDVAQIPAGVSQRITNIGKTDLVFLCICAPRFRTDAYRSVES